jgi:hypothetical protein
MLDSTSLNNYISRLEESLISLKSNDIKQNIVDAPFSDRLKAAELDLGIIALLIVDKHKKTLNRISISQTEYALSVQKVSVMPFHTIKIPLSDKNNLVVEAIKSNKAQFTTDWKDLLMPALNSIDAELDQAVSATGCSIVVPFKTNSLSGAIIYDFYQDTNSIDEIHFSFAKKYTKVAAAIL